MKSGVLCGEGIEVSFLACLPRPYAVPASNVVCKSQIARCEPRICVRVQNVSCYSLCIVNLRSIERVDQYRFWKYGVNCVVGPEFVYCIGNYSIGDRKSVGFLEDIRTGHKYTLELLTIDDRNLQVQSGLPSHILQRCIGNLSQETSTVKPILKARFHGRVAELWSFAKLVYKS